MFGFLSSGPVKEDAAVLYKFMEMSVNRYSGLDEDALRDRIASDFPPESRHVDDHSINFYYRELRDFDFVVSINSIDKTKVSIMALGSGRYEGFSLYAEKDSGWHTNASDGIVAPATGGAKQLAAMMSKMYANIQNFSDLF